MEVKFKQQKWFFKDRSSIASGMFGIPITYLILACSIIMVILFLVTWLIEGKILLRVIGFELPLIIKMFSLTSTMLLFTFLLKSTGVIYLVVVSSVFYFISHTMLLSGMVEFFLKFKEYDRPLMNMLYYSPNDMDFHFLIAICLVRVLMGIPFSYYSLVLFSMRKAGGSGWDRIPAFKLEDESIPMEIEKLEKRHDYVKKRIMIMDMK